MIRGAAEGGASERAAFAERYEPVVRAYLGARWRASAYRRELDDAVQEVFVDCFRAGGVLEKADPDRGGFRAFLYGVVRNVALRLERSVARRDKQADSAFGRGERGETEEALSRVFDRAWAQSLMRQAALHMAAAAPERGNGAPRRVELLKLRFQDDLPIREIAKAWDEDPAHLHHEYAKARREFRAALVEVVKEHEGASTAAAEAECERLVAFLA